MTTKWKGAKDWFQLTFNGGLVEEGEDKIADFCIKARLLGPGAKVQAIKHPVHGYQPFGFWYVPGEEECRWQQEYVAREKAGLPPVKIGDDPPADVIPESHLDTDKEVLDALQAAVVELQRLHNIHGSLYAGKVGEPDRAIIAEGDAVLRKHGRVGVYGLPGDDLPEAQYSSLDAADDITGFVIAVGDPFSGIRLFGPFSDHGAAQDAAQNYTLDPWWVVAVHRDED